MKKYVDNLLKNRNIEESLKQYAKEFKKLNYRYAMIRLAMNYYTYFTMVSEDEGIRLDYHKEISTINDAIHSLFLKHKTEYARTIEDVEKLRETMVSRTQDLTCYVDRFNIYEHALNRVEYRFKDQDYPEDYSDEALTRELMQFILEDEDSVVVNQKISQVIGQLPIRMTKNKFFEMVAAGLSIYRDGTKSSLNDFTYMLRTSGMLEESVTMEENYPDLQESLNKLKAIHFKSITYEDYDEMRYNIDGASKYMEEQMDGNLMLQELVNDLLLVMYTKEDDLDDRTLIACEEIIKNTNLLFTDKFSEKSLEEIEDMFVVLEGSQEELYPKLTAYDITDNIRKDHKDEIEKLGLESIYETVYKLPRLNADSLFASIDEEADESPLTEKDLKEEKEKLILQFQKLFEENEKSINRAVMSMILSELPVFFNNISELQDYIYNNLSICTDKAEKLACIEILNGIMEG